MSDELIIRPIEAADFDQVWPIIRDVVQAQETYAFDPNMDRETAWKTWVELPRATFVAEQDGQILGTYYIKANAAGPGDHVCNCGYMTAPAARGRGVAGQLCAHSLEVARGWVSAPCNSTVWWRPIRWPWRYGRNTVSRLSAPCPRPTATPSMGWWIAM